MTAVAAERLEASVGWGPTDGGDGACVLVATADDAVALRLTRSLADRGHSVRRVSDGQAALEALEGSRAEVVLLDLDLPVVHGLNVLSAIPSLQTDARFVVMVHDERWDTVVEALEAGAHDYLRTPVDLDEAAFLVSRAHDEIAVRRDLARIRARTDRLGFHGMVGRSPAMRRLFGTIARVAPTRATVLVTGETGTGKELVAQALHALSDRARRPFVPVNCSALPGSLLESELFGHERGAFTGALRSRCGWIEEAAGGTLFLDEVGTLEESTQVKLLRVLQDRTIHRIGSRTPISVDFRLVAATNLDLAEEVRRGRFREDLYYRLHVFPLPVPPLRERRDDIPLLVHHFRTRAARDLGVEPPDVTPRVLDRLVNHDWPGNVRELENFVERCVILGRTEEPLLDLDPQPVPNALLDTAVASEWTLERLETEYLLRTLDATGGHQAEAARRLGVNRRTVYRKLKRLREQADG